MREMTMHAIWIFCSSRKAKEVSIQMNAYNAFGLQERALKILPRWLGLVINLTRTLEAIHYHFVVYPSLVPKSPRVKESDSGSGFRGRKHNTTEVG